MTIFWRIFEQMTLIKMFNNSYSEVGELPTLCITMLCCPVVVILSVVEGRIAQISPGASLIKMSVQQHVITAGF